MPNPDTVVLIHGLWLTNRDWAPWVAHYEAKGYKVLTPAYPASTATPRTSAPTRRCSKSLTFAEVVDHMAEVVGALDSPPIIMGHSQGGLTTQVLLDRGLGAAGVAIDSVPPEGVRVNPPSQLKSIWPAVKHPSNRHGTADFTFEQFQYAFLNTLPEDAARRVYEEQYIPGPGPIVFGGVLANLKPGHQDTYVNFKNDDRAPLLLIAGGEDHIMPPAVNKSNFKHYKSDVAVTEYKEFEGRSHYTCGEPGWEEVADYALAWAVEHAASPAPA